MSLVNDGSNMVMPVGPMNGYGNSYGMGMNDGSFWLLVLFLFGFMNGGWGFGNGAGGAMPFMMNNTTNNDVQRGFDQQAVMGGINGINTALANAEVSRCNSQANILQSLNQLSMGLQNCCCENRAGLADLKYTVATEACADRQAVTNALFDVTTANNANTQALMSTINSGIQSIQDKLCQQEIEALKTQNQNLQTQLNMANLSASQTAQTARILQDNAAQTVALEQYLNPAPVPAYVVQNPNCCTNQNFGCGCGM